jgi:phospholipase/lecithinase/hemolysin
MLTRMKPFALIVALAGATTSLPAAAATFGVAPDRYTGLIVFGDSLSDPGNLFGLTGGEQPPSPPYAAGRFSSGPVWVEYVADRFEALQLPVANLAFGGARALTQPVPPPDLEEQIGRFALAERNRFDGRAAVVSMIGANDLIEAVGWPADLRDARAREAAEAVARGALTMASFGFDRHVIANMPDLGRLPAFNLFRPDLAAGASAATEAFNEHIEKEIELLQAAGLRVETFDLRGAIDALIADPASFGVANAVIPCIIPGVSVCTPDEAAELGFFDGVHPGGTVHATVGRAMRGAIAPVPLPAPALLLVAAVAGLGLAGRRRRTGWRGRQRSRTDVGVT